MIAKLVLLCALVAAPAVGSAIKGYARADEATKGSRLATPIEQHRVLAEQATKTGQRIEQPVLVQQQREEPVIHQQRLESKLTEEAPKRYEAKTQVRDESTKGQVKIVEEQQRELVDVQQVEEQRRYEEGPVLVQQPILPLAPIPLAQEKLREEIVQAPVKGGPAAVAHSGAAPLGMAEPYAFNYQVEGSSRSESGDANGVVRGQYTIQSPDGSSRIVDYVADHNGFRAAISTNEFGTEAASPAGVALRSSQPAAQDISLSLEGKTREDLLPPPALKAAPVPPKPDNWAVKGQPAFPQAAIVVEEIRAPKRLVEESRASAKGQRLIQQEEQEIVAHEPIKSAELRAPKAETKTRSGFESATAHRVYRPVVHPIEPVIRPLVPPVPARAPVPIPVVASRPAAVRAPVSPVVGYRRAADRASHYASGYELTDEQPAGFEISEN